MTKNDRAWNEYIKTGYDCIELGSFKSTTARGTKQWPVSSPLSFLPSSQAALTTNVGNQYRRATTTSATVIHRTTAETTRAYEKNIARKALQLARTSIDKAMDLIKIEMPEKFLLYSSWYENVVIFKEVNTYLVMLRICQHLNMFL